ncbi:lipid A export permease/ATP-binding protein MsbA [Bacterioplanoides sp.]|uniref:lipid A export permease/ATP-binding protein MsbA n=1 Tax=Bacterioplanoides sp. TaxID=2066072 RepID=UPI003B00D56B
MSDPLKNTAKPANTTTANDMAENYTTGRLYKRLLSYVWPHKFAFAVSIFGFMLFATAAPAMAWMMGEVQATLNDPQQQRILLLIATLVGIFMYRGVATFLGKYFTAIVGRSVVHTLRTELFEQMMRLPTSYYDKESRGRLISRITFDIEQVTGASTKALTILVQEGMTVIFLMGYLIYLDYTLTFIFLALVPVIGALVGLASRFFRKYSRRIQKSIGNVTQVANETINGFREVRTFGGREYEEQRFLKTSEYNRKQALKFALTNAVNVPLNQQIVALGLGAMVYFMFQRVSAGSMSSEEFMVFITAASLIAKPIRALTNINSVIQKGVVAAESVFTILDTDQEVDKGDQQLDRCRGDLCFDAVSFRYENAETNALNNIKLDVKAGTSVAFVGKSGSGKSTLANLIPRFYDVSEGRICLDGIDIRDLTLDNLRQQVAIVSQNVTLFNGSIKDNIAYGALSTKSDDEIFAAAKAAHVDEFVEKLEDGFDTEVGESGVLLSGGQRQRIAIARALLKDAPILILDEATSALDTQSERHIQAAMEEVMKGRTTFVIAHRLSTIESVDRIIVVDKGEIKEDGSHDELLQQQGLYAQLHQLQDLD